MSNGSGSCSPSQRTEPRFWAAAVLVFALLVWAAVRLIPPPAPHRTAPSRVDAPAFVVPIEFKLPGKVNINLAPTAELENLPGIGPALAARIIAYREQHGPLKSIEDLIHVSGIVPKTLDGFRDLITVEDEP